MKKSDRRALIGAFRRRSRAVELTCTALLTWPSATIRRRWSALGRQRGSAPESDRDPGRPPVGQPLWVRGSEALGGGMSAIFALEMGWH
jgi:hypothetical protein